MLNGSPVLDIQLFKKLTLKIQGQSHGWGQSSSHNVSLTSYRLTSLWFHVNQPSHSWNTAISNLTLQIQGQGHSSRSQSRYNTLSTHILPFIPCRSALPFQWYSYFKIWHWKVKVKFMGEVKVENPNMGPTFCRLTSLLFHVNWSSHSWVTIFSKFDLENHGSRSWVRSQFKVTMWI